MVKYWIGGNISRMGYSVGRFFYIQLAFVNVICLLFLHCIAIIFMSFQHCIAIIFIYFQHCIAFIFMYFQNFIAIIFIFFQHCITIIFIYFQHCFAIMYRRENQRQYEMRANSASECQSWIDNIKMARWGDYLPVLKVIPTTVDKYKIHCTWVDGGP